jgi:hypothetical protein
VATNAAISDVVRYTNIVAEKLGRCALRTRCRVGGLSAAIECRIRPAIERTTAARIDAPRTHRGAPRTHRAARGVAPGTRPASGASRGACAGAPARSTPPGLWKPSRRRAPQ